MKMVLRNTEVTAKELSPGARRKILARGGGLMAVEVRFDAGTEVPTHAHRHEQVSYVVSGKIELTMDGKTEVLQPGDSFYAAPDVVHGVKFLADSIVVDTFTPQREDFL
jgi:quercetin dioxygenase-like cupin family protein